MTEAPSLQELDRDLKTAREDLANLEADHATLIAHVDAHELHFERLKESNAPMHERIEVRSQLTATRELILEQDAAIRDARARVTRLESAVHRESVVVRLLDLATRMHGTQGNFDHDLERLEADLLERLTAIYPSIILWRKQRAAFQDLLGELGVRQMVLHGSTQYNEHHYTRLDALLLEIKARGVDPSPLTTRNAFVGTGRELHQDIILDMPATTAARTFTSWLYEHEARLALEARAKLEAEREALQTPVILERREFNNGVILELPVTAPLEGK